MAEKRQIIIDVDVNDNNLDQAIGELNTSIKENREEIKELNKDYKENATEIAALERKNKDLAASKREVTKQSKIESGSLNDLRKQLSNATKERNNLNLTTKEGREEAVKFNKQILDLTDSIKEQEEAGGDFRRSVGDYPQLFQQAAGGIKVFGTSLSDVFKIIVANPIGLLVSALAGLVAIFKETQAGAEFFRKTGAALNTTFGLLKDIVEETGVALIEAFENPKQTLIDLKDAIVENVLNYFTEFIPNAINKVIEGFGLLGKAVSQLFEGEFSAALDTATDASVKLLDGLTDLNPAISIIKETFKAAVPAIQEFVKEVNTATDAAFSLEEQLIANEKALADLRVSQAQSILTQKELNLIVEDTTKSFEDRIAAAEQFAQVEANQIAESIRLQEERIEILKAQNDLTNSTEEDIQRVRDAEIELANLQAASFERQVTNQNKLNTIRQQQTNENLALENAATKEREKLAKKEADTKINLEQQVSNAKGQLALGTLSLIEEVAGEGTAIAKIAASIQAGINTAQGITAALGSAPPPFNFALAALTGAAGAVQIAKINSTNTDVKSRGSSSSPSIPSAPSSSVSTGSGLSSVNASLLGQFSEGSQQAAATAEATGNAVGSNFPTVQVAVTDINDGQAALNAKVTETTLG